MSHTTTVTIHCDGCGQWEHASSGIGPGDAASYRHSRIKRGWTTTGTRAGGDREDYCPICSSRINQGGE